MYGTPASVETALETVLCMLWICFVIHPQGISSQVISTGSLWYCVSDSIWILTVSCTDPQHELRKLLQGCRISCLNDHWVVFYTYALHQTSLTRRCTAVQQHRHWSALLLHQTSCCGFCCTASTVWSMLHKRGASQEVTSLAQWYITPRSGSVMCARPCFVTCFFLPLPCSSCEGWTAEDCDAVFAAI